MRLNELRPEKGSRAERTRVGRGAGSGLGKTAGKGHKGQLARSGGKTIVGFEGGQMPLQRRLPKVGFRSRRAERTDEVRLDELQRLEGDVADLAALIAAGYVDRQARRVKVIASGKLERAMTIKGLIPTQGARKAIEAAGGRIEE